MKHELSIKYLLIAGSVGFIIHNSLFVIHKAEASHTSSNISTTDRFAWNDVIGWIDFGREEVEVTADKLKGYASSQAIGIIALDCATAPVPNCGGSAGAWGVVNDRNGNLSGWAWNENIGWISFSGANYGVTIDILNGDFGGWAWNDIIGWISFNCANISCASSNYKVKTNFYPIPPPLPPDPGDGGGFGEAVSLTSSIFDTQVRQGAAINTIMWQGEFGGGAVGFQFASSNSINGPWNFVGPDVTANSYYEPLPGLQQRIGDHHNNQRYLKYRVFLDSLKGSPGPEIKDIAVGFSP